MTFRKRTARGKTLLQNGFPPGPPFRKLSKWLRRKTREMTDLDARTRQMGTFPLNRENIRVFCRRRVRRTGFSHKKRVPQNLLNPRQAVGPEPRALQKRAITFTPREWYQENKASGNKKQKEEDDGNIIMSF